MKPTLEKAKFTIETFPGEIFYGFTLGEDWNGWACPYFELDEANRILDIYNINGGSARYDELNDVFIFSKEEVFPNITIEDKKLYPVGNSYWIWEEKFHQ